MRAGNLDRRITIQRATSTINDYGTPTDGWADVVTVRAQQVMASTDEYIRAAGASDETVVVFRTWWIDDLTNADRVIYDGKIHNIKELKELGRRDGLEIRTHSFGQVAA